MKFNPELIAELKSKLNVPSTIVIVTHRNPDGDALGSSLGFKFFLEKLGHKAFFISPNTITNNLKWIPGTADALIFDNESQKKTVKEVVSSADIIFCLDFNAISRLETLGEEIVASKAYKVVIDHHQQPEPFPDLLFSNTSYCATAEMVYDVIEDLTETDKIDKTIALCLYTGIVTDNGFFQFNNTTPNSLRVAAELVAHGARPDLVSEKVNNTFRENRLKFFGYCLAEKLKLVKGNKVAYMVLSQSEIKKFNLQAGDSEGLVNYPFKIESVVMSVYFSEEPDRTKISFRSRGDVDVNYIARTYFEGGGHKNASGGRSNLSLAETEKKFLEIVNNLSL